MFGPLVDVFREAMVGGRVREWLTSSRGRVGCKGTQGWLQRTAKAEVDAQEGAREVMVI